MSDVPPTNIDSLFGPVDKTFDTSKLMSDGEISYPRVLRLTMEAEALQKLEAMIKKSPFQAGKGYHGLDIAAALKSAKNGEAIQQVTALKELNETLFVKLKKFDMHELFAMVEFTPEGVIITSTSIITSYVPGLTAEKVIANFTEMVARVRKPELRALFCNDLAWSYDTVMDSISDPNLRTEVVNSLSAYPEHKRNGVLAFFFLLENIAKFRTDQGAELRKALYDVPLSSFAGYNVNSYVALFRTVSDVLSMRGVDLSDAKEHIIKHLGTAPHRRFTLGLFFYDRDHPTATYESLLAESINLYLKFKSDWTTETRTGAVFQGAVSAVAAPGRAAPSAPPSNLRGGTRFGAPNRARSRTPSRRPANGPRSNAPQGRKTHDFLGNPIDYNPPAAGASHTRGTGPNDKWCGHERCQRWGSHLTDEHPQWFANLKQRRSGNRRSNNGRPSGRPSGQQPSSAANDHGLQMPRSHLLSHF
jgi:hypothetical protein